MIHWYLNGRGDASYPNQEIWGFRDDGYPVSTDPIVARPGGIDHLAWPSVVRVAGQVYLFASGYDGAWSAFHLWTGDGVTFSYVGAVFEADGSEPNGIGPGSVRYDAAAGLFYLYYGIRSASGPALQAAVATSPDGETWTREGVVLSGDLVEDIGGLAVSYVRKQPNGQHLLFYLGFTADLTTGTAIVAKSSDPLGAFGGKIILKRPDGFATTVSGEAGRMCGTVPVDASVPIGIPLLINDGSAREGIVAKRQHGSLLWFDRPLLSDHTDADLLSMARFKVDPSWIRQKPSGAWEGIFTIFGPEVGVVAEYTVGATAPHLAGPWTFDKRGFRFQPFMPAHAWSIENPIRIEE